MYYKSDNRDVFPPLAFLLHVKDFCRGDSLGISLFQERAPELVSIWRAEVNQLVVHSGQQVVYPHLLPLAVLPELATGGDSGRSRSTLPAQSTRRMQASEP